VGGGNDDDDDDGNKTTSSYHHQSGTVYVLCALRILSSLDLEKRDISSYGTTL
jgi:hypothetical protein